MLARANRVLRPDDFRQAVRRGRRVSTAHAVLYLYPRPASEPTRFGFIVSKAVGNAVTRNLVRRRMRAVAHDVLPSMQTGADVVVRGLPGVDQVPWQTLASELTDAMSTGAMSTGRPRA
ncbi:ribonuclease P protein component [Salinibacterium sp. ZJ454]|uniref:ribonuclease P protein component n=1 Tax=Salinibacterium sp. ZJ454 TaxID=2708339 RepID=UPI00141F103D|nr:ribonuclease P protein component [Salinibacterium sp. ZJ454]